MSERLKALKASTAAVDKVNAGFDAMATDLQALAFVLDCDGR